MPNYIINHCLTNDQYIISADTLTVGDSIEFGIGETIFCGTVGSVTDDPITPGYYYGLADYVDCCLCLSANTESLNFSFIRCGTLEEINIEAFNFCRDFGLPTTGLTYEIQLGSDTPFCATFEGLIESGETNYSYVSGPFLVCDDCNISIPKSANTEVTICVVLCDQSVVSVTPPHPEWTDGYGTQVTQLNMVVLGGPNGLNS